MGLFITANCKIKPLNITQIYKIRYIHISKLTFCPVSDTPLQQCLHNIDLSEILRLPAIGLHEHR
jgi:hypothetical protein